MGEGESLEEAMQRCADLDEMTDEGCLGITRVTAFDEDVHKFAPCWGGEIRGQGMEVMWVLAAGTCGGDSDNDATILGAGLGATAACFATAGAAVLVMRWRRQS